MPNIGDDAIYDIVEVASNGATVQGQSEVYLQSYDASTNTWLERYSLNLNGQGTVENRQIAGSDLLSDAVIQASLSNCGQSGGSLQVVSVPAGTFTACAVPCSSAGGQGTMWIANVVFGYVKLQVVSGGVMTAMQLRAQAL